MRQTLTRLQRAIPSIGKRLQTEKDFFEICEKEEIEVVFNSNISNGCYVVFDNHYFIFLNKKLKGFELLRVGFHELGHHFLHHPLHSSFGVSFFDLHTAKKQDREAEMLAALALVSVESLNDPNAETKSSKELFELRKLIFQKFNV